MSRFVSRRTAARRFLVVIAAAGSVLGTVWKGIRLHAPRAASAGQPALQPFGTPSPTPRARVRRAQPVQPDTTASPTPSDPPTARAVPFDSPAPSPTPRAVIPGRAAMDPWNRRPLSPMTTGTPRPRPSRNSRRPGPRRAFVRAERRPPTARTTRDLVRARQAAPPTTKTRTSASPRTRRARRRCRPTTSSSTWRAIIICARNTPRPPPNTSVTWGSSPTASSGRLPIGGWARCYRLLKKADPGAFVLPAARHRLSGRRIRRPRQFAVGVD